MGCKYEFKIGHTRGLVCNRKPVLPDGYCFWHSPNPKKIYSGKSSLKRELEMMNESRESLEGFEIYMADLSYIQLGGSDLRYASIIKSNLVKARFQGAEMEQINLLGSNISGANLKGANLTGANLDSCILQEADFTGAILCGANLDRANLEGAVFRSANLEGAVLTNANLFGCDFENASLKRANLERANLECASLISADIKSANLLGITYNPLTCFKNIKNFQSAIGIPAEWTEIWNKRQEIAELWQDQPFGKENLSTTSLKNVADLREGDFFGDRNEFKILKMLGKGGYAFVFKVEDQESQIEKIKAVKILDPHLSADESNIKRFKREGLIGKNLRHPRIIKVHDLRFSKEYDCYYIIMEYVEGTDLKSLMRRYKLKNSPFPLSAGLHFVKQICEGLIVAHENGIIHRDLKPGNILIDRKGNVVITDFGLSKITESLTSSLRMSTQPGTLLGTFEYMSPEQVLGEQASPSIDIYALGVIMYELFTGRSPYTAKNILAWINVIRHFQPLKPSEINPTFPEWLSEIIMKCLEKNPDNRYKTVKELLSALQNKKP